MFLKYGFKHKVEGDLLWVSYAGLIFKRDMDEIMGRVYELIKEHSIKRILINAIDSDVKLELAESLAFVKGVSD